MNTENVRLCSGVDCSLCVVVPIVCGYFMSYPSEEPFSLFHHSWLFHCDDTVHKL